MISVGTPVLAILWKKYLFQSLLCCPSLIPPNFNSWLRRVKSTSFSRKLFCFKTSQRHSIWRNAGKQFVKSHRSSLYNKHLSGCHWVVTSQWHTSNICLYTKSSSILRVKQFLQIYTPSRQLHLDSVLVWMDIQTQKISHNQRQPKLLLRGNNVSPPKVGVAF